MTSASARSPGHHDGPRLDRFLIATLTVMVIDLMFGGATQPDAVSSLVARLASLPLLCMAVWRLRDIRLGWSGKLGLGLLAAIVAVPILQCVPMPPSLWERLPGRQAIVADYAAAGIPAPWAPMTLSPYETQDVLLWLVPSAAMFLAGLGLRGRGAVVACLAIPVVGVVAVALGLMQVLGGPESALRFYAFTNLDSAVGFFANRNHEAAFLVVGLALAPLWVTAIGNRETGNARVGALIAVALQILLIVGIGVTRSRAGVLIGIAVLLLAAMITATSARDRNARRAGLLLFIAALLGAALVGLFARTALVERFHAPIGAELRIQTAPTVRRAAETFFPFGSGLGSFDAVYREVEPLSAVTSSYFNHAHDDAMEVVLETGAAGVAVFGAFLVWWLWLTIRLLLGGRTRDGVGLYASLAVLALMAHSLVDYPLRTTALFSLFALACGVMAARDHGAARPRRTEPRRVNLT